MEKDADEILKSLKQYESQLQQVRQAIKSTSNDSDNNDLLALESDIQELISLTKETLSNLPRSSVKEVISSSTDTVQDSFSDEYALFKAELAELEGSSPEVHSGTGTDPFKTEDTNSNTCNLESDNDCNADGLTELQEELDALKGSKCQAPHKQQWGDISYHNALIMEIETNDRVNNIDHIQVRVMFVNPTEKDMLPCPYFLDGECRFSDDKCHFSHGHLVPVSKIKEFREPDFTSLKKGSQILAKQKDNLWHRAKVEDILNNNQCLIQFESKGCELVELDLQDILPLEPGNKDEDGSESSSDSEEDVLPQEYFVQLSLLRTPPSLALGAWEKHTKGIGSRLMANMGYVIGCGLGKNGEGRLEPVEAMAYPPGKSLDACMALREAAGGDQNMFKAEQRQKKQARQLLRLQQRQNLRKYGRKDVFSFINSKLSGSIGSKPEEESNKVALSSSSRKGLNVERFRLGENIKKTQKDISKLNQSLKRHEVGSTIHNTLTSKLKEAQSELNRLQNNDNLVAKEQDQREGRKKITVF